MRNLLFALFYATIVVSCSEEEARPDNLIERELFVEILSEAQIFESAKQYIADRNVEYSLPKSYAYLFQKYNIQEGQWEATLDYYTQDPAEFEQICDEVIVRLTEMQAKSLEAKQQPDS